MDYVNGEVGHALTTTGEKEDLEHNIGFYFQDGFTTWNSLHSWFLRI